VIGSRSRSVRWLVVLGCQQPGGLDQVVGRHPRPHQIWAPWRPSSRVRAQPKRCLSWLMRPSQPVRHLTSRRKGRARSIAWRVGPARPLRGTATRATPGAATSRQAPASPEPRSAVTAPGGLWVWAMTRPMAGTSSGASGGLPTMTVWSHTIPSGLSATWALPVGHPPVNGETFASAWLLLSSSHGSPQPGPTAAHRAVPVGTGAQPRPLPPTKGWRTLMWEERSSPHMAATSRSGVPAMTRAPACERPALPWCSEAVASGDVMVDRVVPTGCGRLSLVRLSSRR
jgi:hypothetical protein